LLTSRQIFRYAVPARTVTKKHWSLYFAERRAWNGFDKTLPKRFIKRKEILWTLRALRPWVFGSLRLRLLNTLQYSLRTVLCAFGRENSCKKTERVIDDVEKNSIKERGNAWIEAINDVSPSSAVDFFREPHRSAVRDIVQAYDWSPP